ncbi:synA, partial [Acrasis kona]
MRRLVLLFLCLSVAVFAGDLPVQNFLVPPETKRLTLAPMSLPSPTTTKPPVAVAPISTKVLFGSYVQSFINDKSPMKCPPVVEKENAPIGGGDVRRHSNYFLAKDYKLAASCRLDCTSKVSGQVHFDGGCKHRYFYYGNTGRCLVAGELNDAQAKLAEAYCMSCNGCIKTHNRAFNAAIAKGV